MKNYFILAFLFYYKLEFAIHFVNWIQNVTSVPREVDVKAFLLTVNLASQCWPTAKASSVAVHKETTFLILHIVLILRGPKRLITQVMEIHKHKLSCKYSFDLYQTPCVMITSPSLATCDALWISVHPDWWITISVTRSNSWENSGKKGCHKPYLISPEKSNFQQFASEI